jgi:hypothetical protein
VAQEQQCSWAFSFAKKRNKVCQHTMRLCKQLCFTVESIMPKRIVMRRQDMVTFAAALHNNISFLQRKGLSNASLKEWAKGNCPAAHISRDGIKTVCDIAEALGLIDHKPGNKGWPIKRKTKKKLPKSITSNIEKYDNLVALDSGLSRLSGVNPQKLDILLKMDPAKLDLLLELAQDPPTQSAEPLLKKNWESLKNKSAEKSEPQLV